MAKFLPSRNRLALWTVLLIILALFAALYWIVTERHPEPVLVSFVLLSTILGIFADRWVATKEKRSATLKVLVEECYKNIRVQKQISEISERNDEAVVELFPRFYVSTVQATIASGIFSGERDAELNVLMHDWLQRGTEANDRLAITEIRLMVQPSKESVGKFREKLKASEVQNNAEYSLTALVDCLLEEYSPESGIDKNTILFNVHEHREDT